MASIVERHREPESGAVFAAEVVGVNGGGDGDFCVPVVLLLVRETQPAGGVKLALEDGVVVELVLGSKSQFGFRVGVGDLKNGLRTHLPIWVDPVEIGGSKLVPVLVIEALDAPEGGRLTKKGLSRGWDRLPESGDVEIT